MSTSSPTEPPAMGEVLIVGPEPAEIDHLAAHSPALLLRVGADDVPRALRDGQTLAVLADASAGVRLARVVHDAGCEATVIFLAPDAATSDRLRAELAITPGIGRETTCIRRDQAGWEQAVADEIERAQLRLEHRATLAQLRDVVGVFDATTPEALSVYLGQLFEHAPIGILLVDPDGVVRAANPTSGDVLGWQPRHAVGAALAGMFTAQDADMARALLERAVEGGAPTRDLLTRTGPDGADQHLEVTVAPVDPEHWDLGAFVLLRDESARLHALEATERARRAAEADAARYAELAWTLQESLLPPDMPEIAGIQVGARYHPAGDGSEIGGDFYDIFELGEGEWLAVMGDVCGKGAGAARLTALSRYTLRAVTVRSPDLERNLIDLNTVLAGQYERDRPRNQHRFATAVVARFRPHPDGGFIARVGSGGHPAPLVLRGDGTVEELDCRGPLLGVFDTGTFETVEVRLAAGESLVLYTDGVTEARRGRDEFGEDRLRQLLTSKLGRPASSIAGAIQASVLEFQGGVARDDIAVLALRAGS